MNSFGHCNANFDEIKDAFMRIFPMSIVGQIALETNRKAKRTFAKNQRKGRPTNDIPWKDTDPDEIYAYIAILLYSGAEKANTVQAKDLFHQSNMPFYRAVMSLERFEQLSRFLCFDDKKTRLE